MCGTGSFHSSYGEEVHFVPLFHTPKTLLPSLFHSSGRSQKIQDLTKIPTDTFIPKNTYWPKSRYINILVAIRKSERHDYSLYNGKSVLIEKLGVFPIVGEIKGGVLKKGKTLFNPPRESGNYGIRDASTLSFPFFSCYKKLRSVEYGKNRQIDGRTKRIIRYSLG